MSVTVRSQILAWTASILGSAALFSGAGVLAKRMLQKAPIQHHEEVEEEDTTEEHPADHHEEKTPAHKEEHSSVKAHHDEHASHDEATKHEEHKAEAAHAEAEHEDDAHEEHAEQPAAAHGKNLCETGKEQSPVDLTGAVESAKLTALQFHYPETSLELVNNPKTQTIEAVPQQVAELVENGVRYRLKEFHFRNPSEHRIDGIPGALEIHFTHVGPKGDQLIVAALVDDGKMNPTYASVMQNLPKAAGKKASVKNFHLKSALPDTANYYTYRGSLTKEPCSEGVRWIVLKQTLMMSGAQIDAFAHLYPKNARSMQALHERDIAVTIDSREALAH